AAQECEQHGRASQAQRDREACGDQFRDAVVLVLERRAEVAAGYVPEIAAELLHQRLVQVVGRAQVRLDLRGQLLLGVERPARRGTDHEERQRDEDQERRNRAEETGQRVSQHGLFPWYAISSSPPAPL